MTTDVHRLETWNPCNLEDRAAEHDAALSVCDQWTRAEPGFRSKTTEEVEAEQEAWLAGLDARVAAEVTWAEGERAERATGYEPRREAVRLAYLEERGLLADKIRERDEIVSGQLFLYMEDKRKQAHLAGLDRAITRSAQAADQLAKAVGDPETVVDRDGWLPAERRELSLARFRAGRITEVRELRTRVQARQAG
jgi:hypothetical protein